MGFMLSNGGLCIAILLGGTVGRIVVSQWIVERDCDASPKEEAVMVMEDLTLKKEDVMAVQDELLMRGIDAWVETGTLTSHAAEGARDNETAHFPTMDAIVRSHSSSSIAKAAAAAFARSTSVSMHASSLTTKYPSVALMDYKEAWSSPYFQPEKPLNLNSPITKPPQPAITMKEVVEEFEEEGFLSNEMKTDLQQTNADSNVNIARVRFQANVAEVSPLIQVTETRTESTSKTLRRDYE